MLEMELVISWFTSEIAQVVHLYIIFIVVGALSAYALIRFLLVPLILHSIEGTKARWSRIFADNGVYNQTAFLGSALVLYGGFLTNDEIPDIAHRIVLTYVVINSVIIQIKLLSSGLQIYEFHSISAKRPIKGYVQLAKIIVYVLGAGTVAILLLNISAIGFFSAVGASLALLVLVFRDTILAVIANLQLISNDLVRVGDWIEVPDKGVNGHVTDIALHTVKVRNFDNTMVSVPTQNLINGSFTNWRGMEETKGRRIKRSILIDQTSVRFCDGKMVGRFRQINRLKTYMDEKLKAIKKGSEPTRNDDGHLLNQRVLSNLGTFRAYALAYLNENPRIRKDMTIMVRQLQPTAAGIPIEIYFFTDETGLVPYESFQSDIFDHLISALSYFELRIYQHPAVSPVAVPQ